MKRYFALCLTVMMLCSFTACGGAGGAVDGSQSQAVATPSPTPVNKENPYAKKPDAELAEHTLYAIRTAGTLTVAIAENQAPYCFRSDATLCGSEVALAQRLGEMLGVASVELLLVGPNALVDAVRTGAADIALGAQPDKDPEALGIALCDPYMGEYGVVLRREDVSAYKKVESFEGKTLVHLESDKSAVSVADELLEGVTLEAVPTMAAALRKLRGGNCEGVLLDWAMVQTAAGQNLDLEASTVKLNAENLSVYRVPYVLAGNDDLRVWINQTLAANIKQGAVGDFMNTAQNIHEATQAAAAQAASASKAPLVDEEA